MWVKTYLSKITTKNYLENNNIPYLFFDSIDYSKLLFKNDEIWWTPELDKEELIIKDITHCDLDWDLLNENTTNRIFDEKYIEGCYRHYLNEEEFIDGHPTEQGAKRWSREVLLPKLKELYDFK